jgi:transposase
VPVCLAVRACVCARPGCRRPRRYPSDTADAEWALLAPLLPVPACQTKVGGRPETHCRRAVVDAIRYLVHNGCVWRALPADFLSVTWNQTFWAILSGTVSPVAEERRWRW